MAARGKLPKYARGLRGFVVVAPHGEWIADGSKTHLVKSKRYKMAGEPLLVIQRKKALAVIVPGEPEEISLAEFKRRRGHHLVSEKERKSWWRNKSKFYYYPIQSVRRLRTPVPVEYPQGPQVFVRPENVRPV